jgi:protein-S-isoprenylcysteine O-methyltransferase Ste14
MNERAFFNILLVGWFVLAAVIFVTLFFIVAPYGRHSRRRWGPQIGDKLGWVVMEAPSPILFVALFILGIKYVSITTVAFLILWEAHYIHRAFIYPFSRRAGASGMAAVVVGMGFLFNIGNAYLNGRYLFTLSGGYENSWLMTPQFMIGAALFVAGFIINRWADDSLRNLRQPGESSYKIPEGGLYRWISCPNYFGEMVTWTGWAVATWSLPGLAFAVFTVANLAPRARAHHIWYKRQFKDYPPQRKALVPAIW